MLQQAHSSAALHSRPRAQNAAWCRGKRCVQQCPRGSQLPSRAAASQQGTGTGVLPAKDVIVKFYTAYNAGDIDTIASLMAPDVIYHDMIYEEPFRGREEVVAYMKKVSETVPEDLRFVMDDITGEEKKVGIIWHVEIGDGTQFPFSRGCSFYTMNDQGQILTARDLVESPSKPGGASLGLLSAIAPVIRQLGPKADPSNLKKLPIAAAATWALYAGYMSYIMLSTQAPGLPAWQTPPEVLQEVLHESLNFFYVNVGLNQLGLSLIPDFPEHPVSEALFNLIAAWGLLFLPVMLTEKKSAKPYPPWTQACAAVGLAAGVFSVGWFALGRPELGGSLAERWAYFQQAFSSNRVFYAFVIDGLLYSVWQAVMLETVPTATAFHRFVPFFGLAAHLLQLPASAPAGSTSTSQQQ